MTIGMTMILFFVHWPMWGSMLTRGNDEVSEEDYYLKVRGTPPPRGAP